MVKSKQCSLGKYKTAKKAPTTKKATKRKASPSKVIHVKAHTRKAPKR